MANRFSLKAQLMSFKYALKGIAHVMTKESNFQIQLVIAILVIFTSLYLQINPAEWLWIIFAIASVLTCETLNTAIEKLVDLNEPGQNENAGLIKDIAAGAVLITAFASAIIGCYIFIPKIF